MNIMSAMAPFGPTFAGLGSPAPNNNGQMLMQALELQLAVFAALLQVGGMSAGGANGNSGLMSGNPSFGSKSSANGVNDFLGGSSSAAPMSSSDSGGAGGSGQAAVDAARQFQGKDSISLKGKMKHFTAAGGTNNNCADFVSSALEGQGLVKGHHINVKSFEQELKKQGYRQVPTSQAKPGDVWISNSRGHTELVATKGATRLIGSNNNGDSRQEITEHNNAPGSGIIYQKG